MLALWERRFHKAGKSHQGILVLTMGHENDIVHHNCHLATFVAGHAPYGEIRNGAVVVQAGKIAWAGRETDLPEDYVHLPRQNQRGRWVLPAFVDCHTHLVYAGNRAHEFEMRLQGKTYADIAKAGGGILSTVEATRAASLDQLVAQSLPRLRDMAAEGVGTVEIKSGYGLDVENEIKMLQSARILGEATGVHVHKTLLAAHAVPLEYGTNSDGYVSLITREIMPEASRLGLVDSVDAFCEGIGFTLEQTSKVFEKARELSLPIRLHAEQLSNLHGSAMAADMGALSCDHLEYLDDAGIAAMAKSGTIAVLLPGAFYFLRETKLPPIEAMRREGVNMAIATDCNPGSSPTTSILLMLSMACNLFRMTPEEALTGITRNGAKALGLGECKGQISSGFDADMVAWNIEHPNELAYAFGHVPEHERL